MIDLKGKVAIVTGGCSGIGRGTVKVLHRAGARIACVDVQDDKGHALAREMGDGVIYLHADVTSEDEIAAAFARVVERFGGIDVLFNNAGTAEPLGSDPFDMTIFDGVQKLLVHSVVLGIKYAVPSVGARIDDAPGDGAAAGGGPGGVCRGDVLVRWRPAHRLEQVPRTQRLSVSRPARPPGTSTCRRGSLRAGGRAARGSSIPA